MAIEDDSDAPLVRIAAVDFARHEMERARLQSQVTDIQKRCTELEKDRRVLSLALQLACKREGLDPASYISAATELLK